MHRLFASSRASLHTLYDWAVNDVLSAGSSATNASSSSNSDNSSKSDKKDKDKDSGGGGGGGKPSLASFKEHWFAVTSFYKKLIQKETKGKASDPLDNPEVLKKSKIDEHLLAMVRQLASEEATNDSGIHESGMLDNCLEFFLEERVLDTLCALGEVNRPRGMQMLVMTTLVQLLKLVRQPLLPHMSVHQPVFQLIRVCTTIINGGSCPAGAVGLRGATTFANMDEATSGAFVQLLCVLCHKLLDNPDLLDFFVKDSNPAFKESEFLLFSALMPFVSHSTGPDGDLARSTMLLVVQIQNPRVSGFIVNHSTFCSDLVGELCALYKMLPVAIELDPPPDIAFVKRFYDKIRYFNDLTISAQQTLSQHLVHTLETRFLEHILLPALLQTGEKAAKTATIYMRSIVDQITSPALLHAIGKFLLGSADELETPGGATPRHPLRSTLVRRIDSLAEDLSIATLQLFDRLLARHQEQTTHNLVLRNLPPLAALKPDFFLDPLGFRLNFPHLDDSSADFSPYLLDAEAQTANFYHVFKNGWRDSQRSSADLPAAPASTDLGSFYEGLFLEMLFNKLERLPELSMELNLVLTGVLSKLSQCPHALLHAFFFDLSLPLPPAARSLPRILQQLYQKILLRTNAIPDFARYFARTKYQLGLSNVKVDDSDLDDYVLDATEDQLLRNAVVLEEFVKELCATLLAKKSLSLVIEFL